MDMLYSPGFVYAATDYTSFESSFVKEVMLACEFELYKYMTQHLPEGSKFMALLHQVLTGTNVCIFKDFVLHINATRMSGEMNTSLGNGFSNLMFMLFLCEEIGSTDVLGVVEGDDGLFRVKGRFPTANEFEQLGMKIKLVEHLDICSASFCGIVFDPEDCVNVTDPIKQLITFGWTTRDYARVRESKLKVLLRSKSLSMAHQYPGCPILGSLARYGLRMTRGVDIRHHVKEGKMSLWEREKLLMAISRPIPTKTCGLATRQLVERLYGIPISDQLEIERYLDNLQSLEPLKIPSVESLIPSYQSDYFTNYSSIESRTDPELEKPSLCWPKIKTATSIPWEATNGSRAVTVR
jgi:hypothetical protein